MNGVRREPRGKLSVIRMSMNRDWFRSKLPAVVSASAAMLLTLVPSPASAAGRSTPRSAAEVLCGDTNDDGKVQAGDALAALRASVGSATCMLAACDYNGDGRISASDALSILRKAVGQGTASSCPPASEVEFEWNDGVWGQVLWN